MEEKKSNDARVSSQSLPGLLELQNLHILSASDDPQFCDSWPLDRVHFNSEGHVTFLNLGQLRLRKKRLQLDFPNLTQLSLAGTDLGLDLLTEIVQSHPNLQALFIGGNGYGNAVCQVVPTTPSLTKLDLRYNDIDDITALSSESVRFLYLEGNQIVNLEGFCDRFPNLEELYLGANQIGLEGVQELATHSNLTKIYLEGNRIGPQGAQAFIAALQAGVLSNLKHLYVDNNDIGKEVSQQLAKALNSATAIPDS